MTRGIVTITEIPLEQVKGVLLDFDNTCYEYAPCHEKALHVAYSLYNEMYILSYEDFVTLYKKAQVVVKKRVGHQGAGHSRLLYFQHMVEIKGGRTDTEKIESLEKAYWDAFILEMKPKKEVLEFLAICKKRGVKVCIVTDLTSTVQFRKIRALGISEFIDFVVTSEEAGKDKPDPNIFLLALEKLGLLAEEVIMIGDDKNKDIDGAQNLNITAYMV
jgi:putative hydrolase of the HAD superfamily